MYTGRAQRSSHAARCALVASNAQLTSRDVRRSRPTLNSRHEMYADRVQRSTHVTRWTRVASNVQLTPRNERRSRSAYNSRQSHWPAKAGPTFGNPAADYADFTD